MNKQLTKKIETIKKKVCCDLNDCGQHFVFSITEHELAIADKKKHTYRGSCKKCFKTLKLNSDSLRTFEMVYGKTNINVLKSSFNDMFVED